MADGAQSLAQAMGLRAGVLPRVREHGQHVVGARRLESVRRWCRSAGGGPDQKAVWSNQRSRTVPSPETSKTGSRYDRRP